MIEQDKSNSKSFRTTKLCGSLFVEDCTYLVAGGIAVESTFTVSTFVGGTVLLRTEVESDRTEAESELFFCMDDSLVPQLTTKIPKPKVSNKNFFINILFFGAVMKIQLLFRIGFVKY